MALRQRCWLESRWSSQLVSLEGLWWFRHRARRKASKGQLVRHMDLGLVRRGNRRSCWSSRSVSWEDLWWVVSWEDLWWVRRWARRKASKGQLVPHMNLELVRFKCPKPG